MLAIDLETTSPQRAGRFAVQEARIVGYSVAREARSALYVADTPPQELLDASSDWVAHNAKFEAGVMRRAGLDVPLLHDTKIMAWLLGHPSTHLKDLTAQLLGINPISYSEVTAGRDMSEIPPEEIVEYGAMDADHTLQLYHRLAPELVKYGLWNLYERIERPLVPIIAEMETRGVLIDRGAANHAVNLFVEMEHAAEDEAHQPYNISEDVNIGSPDQLATWLHAEGAPLKRLTGVKKRPSVDKQAMMDLSESGWRPDLVKQIRDFRMFRKLKSFPEKWLEYAAWDGAIHPNFNQCGHYEEASDTAGEAPPGRLSSSSPNVQQIPHQGRDQDEGYADYGDLIRRAAVARPGYLLVSADVSQQEARIAAFVANEPTMLKAFKDGVSVYGGFASEIYGRTITKAEPIEWDTGKRAILTFFWRGANSRPWQERLMHMDKSLSKQEALAAYRRLCLNYPAIEQFREQVIQEIMKNGFVRDWFGRILWVPGAFSANRRMRDAAYRVAFNFKIQAPAASCIKLAMIKLHDEFGAASLDAHIVMQIHDELIFEIREDQLDIALPMIYDMCVGAMPIDFPIEVKIGKNWADLKEI